MPLLKIDYTKTQIMLLLGQFAIIRNRRMESINALAAGSSVHRNGQFITTLPEDIDPEGKLVLYYLFLTKFSHTTCILVIYLYQIITAWISCKIENGFLVKYSSPYHPYFMPFSRPAILAFVHIPHNRWQHLAQPWKTRYLYIPTNVNYLWVKWCAFTLYGTSEKSLPAKIKRKATI